MTDYKHIMKLLLMNTPTSQITALVGCSFSSISQARSVLEEARLDPGAVTALTAEQIEMPFPDGRRGRRPDLVEPDLAKIVEALKAPKKPTLKVLWMKYLDLTAGPGRIHYSYRQFCQLVADHVRRHDLVAVITHEPGQEMYVD